MIWSPSKGMEYERLFSLVRHFPGETWGTAYLLILYWGCLRLLQDCSIHSHIDGNGFKACWSQAIEIRGVQSRASLSLQTTGLSTAWDRFFSSSAFRGADGFQRCQHKASDRSYLWCCQARTVAPSNYHKATQMYHWLLLLFSNTTLSRIQGSRSFPTPECLGVDKSQPMSDPCGPSIMVDAEAESSYNSSRPFHVVSACFVFCRIKHQCNMAVWRSAKRVSRPGCRVQWLAEIPVWPSYKRSHLVSCHSFNFHSKQSKIQ